MEKEKVLVIENSTNITGAVKSICRIAVDLKQYFSFSFIIPKNSKAITWLIKFDLLSVHEINMLEIRKNFWSILMYGPMLVLNTIKVNRIIKKENISLIHNNDLYNLIPVVYKMFGGRVPYVCHVRFLPNRFPPLLFNLWLNLHLRFAKKIIVVSRYLKNQLPDHSKIVFIPNELPIEEKYNPVQETRNVFLYMANYISGKGQDLALKAFNRVHTEIPEWKMRFVGSDMGLEKNKNFKFQLEQYAKENGFADKIEWMGFEFDVEKEYKHATIILNFSESESFSITCLEAQYFGRPLIASDCGGPGEIIQHQQNGWLVPNKSVDLMAKAMKELAINRQLRLKLADNARISSRENYGIEKTSMVLKSIYLEALED